MPAIKEYQTVTRRTSRILVKPRFLIAQSHHQQVIHVVFITVLLEKFDCGFELGELLLRS